MNKCKLGSILFFIFLEYISSICGKKIATDSSSPSQYICGLQPSKFIWSKEATDY